MPLNQLVVVPGFPRSALSVPPLRRVLRRVRIVHDLSDSDGAVSGIAVVGGHVYRGDAFASLSGKYVFGDQAAGGQLFVATPAEEGLWPTEVLEIAESSRDKIQRLFAIGRDRDDELYALTASGVHKLVPST